MLERGIIEEDHKRRPGTAPVPPGYARPPMSWYRLTWGDARRAWSPAFKGTRETT